MNQSESFGTLTSELSERRLSPSLMQLEIRSALAEFLRGELRGLDELRMLAKSAPTETSRAIREFMLTRELTDRSNEFIELLVRIEGLGAVESWIVHGWPEFSHQTKQKVIYPWASDPNGMSIGLAVYLFEHPASTVKERQLLVACLSTSARGRGFEPLVLDLTSRIGRFEDPKLQQALEDFIAGIRQEFMPG